MTSRLIPEHGPLAAGLIHLTPSNPQAAIPPHQTGVAPMEEDHVAHADAALRNHAGGFGIYAWDSFASALPRVPSPQHPTPMEDVTHDHAVSERTRELLAMKSCLYATHMSNEEKLILCHWQLQDLHEHLGTFDIAAEDRTKLEAKIGLIGDWQRTLHTHINHALGTEREQQIETRDRLLSTVSYGKIPAQNLTRRAEWLKNSIQDLKAHVMVCNTADFAQLNNHRIAAEAELARVEIAQSEQRSELGKRERADDAEGQVGKARRLDTGERA